MRLGFLYQRNVFAGEKPCADKPNPDRILANPVNGIRSLIAAIEVLNRFEDLIPDQL
jgi:hypothetical protein